jgi:hypothetical protein
VRKIRVKLWKIAVVALCVLGVLSVAFGIWLVQKTPKAATNGDELAGDIGHWWSAHFGGGLWSAASSDAAGAASFLHATKPFNFVWHNFWTLLGCLLVLLSAVWLTVKENEKPKGTKE